MGRFDEKEVLYLDQVDSEFFDKVIVVLKKNPKLKQKSQKDLVKEAERIVQQYIDTQYQSTKYQSTKPKKSKTKWHLSKIDIFLNISLFLSTLVFLYYVVKLLN